jgi:hypothetical protein
MERTGSWCTKRHLKRARSIDLLIRRKSAEPVRKSKSVLMHEVPLTPRKVGTPKRRVRILSPGGYVEIKSNPENKRYKSIRRIDFSS